MYRWDYLLQHYAIFGGGGESPHIGTPSQIFFPRRQTFTSWQKQERCKAECLQRQWNRYNWILLKITIAIEPWLQTQIIQHYYRCPGSLIPSEYVIHCFSGVRYTYVITVVCARKRIYFMKLFIFWNEQQENQRRLLNNVIYRLPFSLFIRIVFSLCTALHSTERASPNSR